MSKGQAKKNRNERTQFIQTELQSRHKKLAGAIQTVAEGSLTLADLKKLKGELERPVKLSETLSIKIEDCHPSTGPYKRALPKGYQSNITLVKNAIIQAQALKFKRMEEEIRLRQREIVEAFNAKAKDGIQKIKNICAAHDIDSVAEQIADFFHQQKLNLDLEAVGDYLSGPDDESKAVLKAFTGKIDLAGQSFTEGLRNFLKTFRLPGEAQKIDRLVESFSEAYCQQNPGGYVANKDAGYLLAVQTVMLNTIFHNPSAAKMKMDMNRLKTILRGLNNGGNFDENFLQGIYNDIKNNPFELNFVKTNPGYELTSQTLNHDSTFNNLDLLHQPSKAKIQDVFQGIDDKVTVTIDKPKSWLNVLTGYQGTIILSDDVSLEKLVTIQVYNPSLLSKWLFGEHPKVIIQPVSQDGKLAQEAMALAAKIAASFQSPLTSVKATYDYVKSDLQSAYDQQRKLVAPIKSPNKYSWWSREAEKPQSEQPQQGASLGQS